MLQSHSSEPCILSLIEGARAFRDVDCGAVHVLGIYCATHGKVVGRTAIPTDDSYRLAVVRTEQLKTGLESLTHECDLAVWAGEL